jgi:ubiquinone/menaquinone biosynthesis C-methylase UbiE
MRDIERWEREDGAVFLKKMGIHTGQKVLDFGARIGHYSIPLAQAVGRNGVVYALDKDKRALDELRKKATEQGLENVMAMETDGSLEIRLEDGSVDAVLAYDILHLIKDRNRLYRETHRVLKNGCLFSVYPKHNRIDRPGWGLADKTPEDIKVEIETQGFSLTGRFSQIMSHDDYLNYGWVMNFIKV